MPVFLSVRGADELLPVVTSPKAMLVGVTDICGVAATPVPDRATGGTAVAESLATVTLPVTAPAVVGANLTFPTAVVPGVSVSGRIKPETLKPDPVAVSAVTCRSAVPLFRRVNCCVPDDPVVTLPNDMLVGVIASCGAGATPVPVNDTGAAAVPELLVKATLPVKLPPVVGANRTEPATVPPGAIVSGNVKPETENPVPEAVTAETFRVAVPVFLSVSACVAEEPVFTLPNAMLVGVTERTGCTPVPDKVAETLGASLVTVMLPLAVPAVVGAKRTDAVALCPGVRVKGTVTPV